MDRLTPLLQPDKDSVRLRLLRSRRLPFRLLATAGVAGLAGLVAVVMVVIVNSPQDQRLAITFAAAIVALLLLMGVLVASSQERQMERGVLEPLEEIDAAVRRIVLAGGLGRVAVGREWAPEMRDIGAGINHLVRLVSQARVRGSGGADRALIQEDTAAAEAKRKADTDPLTLIFNRQRLERDLEEACTRATEAGEPFTLVIIDIDHFRRFNERFGKQEGDSLLTTMAALLSSSLRSRDSSYRYADDEFALLLPSTIGDQASVAAERIHKLVSQRLSAGGKTVTTCFGVASAPTDGTTPEKLIEAADKAVDSAKHAGRNRIVFHSGTTSSEA